MYDYKLLESFAAVITEGGFEKASKKLFLTQSAVSQRIKALEDIAGSVLLVRKNPPEATKTGEFFLKHYQIVKRLEDELNEGLNPEKNEIRSIPIGINADSLATWFVDSVAGILLDRNITLDIYIDDQDETHKLLKKGVVSGCISSSSSSVQGCGTIYLGNMEYKMGATKSFRERFFKKGFSIESVRKAPAVIFNRKDELHNRYIEKYLGHPPQFPKHFVPSSESFADFIIKGLGYGMVPVIQSKGLFKTRELVELIPDSSVFIDLFWHSWNLNSPVLRELAIFFKNSLKKIT